MNLVSVLEFCQREPLRPVSLALANEHLEVSFDLLVDTLRLPICLWVVRCRRISLNAKQTVHVLDESVDKLWPSIREYLAAQSMFAIDVPDVVHCIVPRGSLSWDWYCSVVLRLHVYEHQNTVIMVHHWQAVDEVN